MNHVPKIAIFDSGMGGTTIFSALRALMPGATYIYAFDNAHFPYGVRSEKEVIQLVITAIDKLVRNYYADLVVIACNTASVSALATARNAVSIPIVGTVPAIKPAALASKTKTIGLLATLGTVVRPYTDELERQFASDCLLLRRGSAKLVEIAERKMHGEAPSTSEIFEEISPLFHASPKNPAQRLDTIVLGCTHFPLLSQEILAAASWPIQLIDSGPAIAVRVKNLLLERGFDIGALQNLPQVSPIALASSLNSEIENVKPALLRLGFSELKRF